MATTKNRAQKSETAEDQEHSQPKESPRIGEMMLARGLITEEQLNVALDHQRATGKLMGETLVEVGALNRADLTSIVAERLGYRFVDLREQVLDPTVMALLPEEVARRYQALAISREDGRLVVAMANPGNVFALDDLRVLTELAILPVMADAEQLAEVLERAYSRSDIVANVDDAVTDLGEEGFDAVGVSDDTQDAPVVRIVQSLLEQAIAERASDIHIEALSDRVSIRFRIDGVLHDNSEVPRTLLRPLVSRIKVLAGIDIARRRVPQDGRFSVNIAGREIDIRVVTLPAGYGEAAVLRLLDRGRGIMSLSDLGFEERDLARYERAFRSPQGWILASGPTGAGKTSTLYATLLELNSRDRSIVSIEDPIEYRLDGLKQIPINLRAGLTFSSALRSILRADPDVILIGEIRDTETAAIAADASITGHLVLSTIHTTRSAAAPMRLVDMGIEPYLVASALSCVVAQRLVRKLCPECSQSFEPDRAVLGDLAYMEEEIATATFRRPVGCPACQRTGYRGRVAIYEVLNVTEDVSRLILARAGTHEIERLAVDQGMQTLQMAARRRAAIGELSIDELVRVVSVD